MENTNNKPVTEDKAKDKDSSVGYWSTPEQVADAVAKEETTAVVETPNEEAVAEPAIEEASVEALSTTEEVVNAPEPESKPEQVQHLGAVKNGVMGTTSVAKPEPRSFEKTKPESSVEKVAIHSTKNVNWEGVGKIYKGYNIVTKDAADQWLTRSHVRLATPEEVKKAFG